jgi:ATP-dependent DNA ligase
LRRSTRGRFVENNDYASQQQQQQQQQKKNGTTTMLQFVVFDVLVWQGKDMMRRPYSERIATLIDYEKTHPNVNRTPK